MRLLLSAGLIYLIIKKGFGIIFPLLILHFAEKQKPVLKATFLSSILFGLIHLIGLIRHPENIWGVINTVIFATGIRCFMAVLFLRTEIY